MISLWPHGFHHSPLLATPIRAVEPAFLAMPGLIGALFAAYGEFGRYR